MSCWREPIWPTTARQQSVKLWSRSVDTWQDVSICLYNMSFVTLSAVYRVMYLLHVESNFLPYQSNSCIILTGHVTIRDKCVGCMINKWVMWCVSHQNQEYSWTQVDCRSWLISYRCYLVKLNEWFNIFEIHLFSVRCSDGSQVCVLSTELEWRRN